MKQLLRAALLLLVVIGVLGGVSVYTVARKGLSTRVTPSAVEEVLALSMRSLATPASVRGLQNPVQWTPSARAEGLEHFADHCAACHANDGSGDTAIGTAFYPPAPDMRAPRTQQLSDGELFSIIENGIRLTGMPAWGTGTPDGVRSSWMLVHFIRQLPMLTAEDITRMEDMNPRTPDQFRNEEAARRFLAGAEPASDPLQPASSHAGGHR